MDRRGGNPDHAGMLGRTMIILGALVVVATGALASVITFNEPVRPPPLAAGNSIPGIATWNFDDLPPVRSIKARDGARLNYRLYPGRPDRVVVLVHGSTGSGAEMLKLSQALQAAGASVYSISLRGHGGSGTTNGDVSYIGQLDDDLVDLVKSLQLDKAGVRRTLAGFSAGGGFVLRIAGGPHAALFDDYLAISPYIAQDSPTNKPNGGWASVAVPRIIALSILHGLGLPWFQDLPVVRFATDAQADNRRTPIYSFRLVSSLQLGRDWRAVLAGIRSNTRMVVGADDELFNADQFTTLAKSLNPRIGVTIVPGETHLGMITDRGATAVADTWRRLSNE